jgi:hypothetical protein
MRGCKLFQFGITVAVTAAVAYLVLPTTDHTNTPGHTTRTKFLLMLCAVFTASCISDFVLQGSLGPDDLDVLHELDLLWLLVPLVDPQHEVWFFNSASKTNTDSKSGTNQQAPRFASHRARDDYPAAHLGLCCVYSTRIELLQQHGHNIILVRNSILVFFAVVGPLQHVAVFIVTLMTKEITESGIPSFVDKHTATGPKHKECMMKESSPDMVGLSKMAHLENLNMPKHQARPSTRRRG